MTRTALFLFFLVVMSVVGVFVIKLAYRPLTVAINRVIPDAELSK